MKLLLENWRKFANEDSSYDVDEAKDIDKIVKAVIIQDGKALILLRSGSQRHAGKWDLPGGHLQEGEDIKDGLLREVYEETALSLKEPIEELYSMKNITYFRVEMPSGEIQLSDEHMNYKFVSEEEIPQNISSKFRIAVIAAL